VSLTEHSKHAARFDMALRRVLCIACTAVLCVLCDFRPLKQFPAVILMEHNYCCCSLLLNACLLLPFLGEATLKGTAGDTPYETCEPCNAPEFSFYPSAPRCSQCLELPSGAAAVCNGPAVVPANGYWQSHPRSPKVCMPQQHSTSCMLISRMNCK
jgi:hypothetical protein